MKLKAVLIVLLAISITTNVIQMISNGITAYPKGLNDIITNEDTAIKLAEAIWLPIYGESIYDCQPFVAEYDAKRKVWNVYGSLEKMNEEYVVFGGVPEISIRSKDGKVVYLNHSM